MWRLTERGAVGIECVVCLLVEENDDTLMLPPHEIYFNGNPVYSGICTTETYLMKIIYFVTFAVLVQYSSFIYMLVASICSAV